MLLTDIRETESNASEGNSQEHDSGDVVKETDQGTISVVVEERKN